MDVNYHLNARPSGGKELMKFSLKRNTTNIFSLPIVTELSVTKTLH